MDESGVQQEDTDVANLAQSIAAVSVHESSQSVSSVTTATAVEVSSADAVDGNIEDDPTVDPNDPTVRWYTVTTGLRVGVFAHWYVSYIELFLALTYIYLYLGLPSLPSL